MKLQNRLFTILFTLLACILQMRADDLSDLIVAISSAQDITVNKKDDTADLLSSLSNVVADNMLNADYFNKIAVSMTQNETFDFILNSVDATPSKLPTELYSTSYRHFSKSMPIYSKGFFRPVPGVVTSNFGWRAKFNRLHKGVDLHLNVGDTVRAAMSGIVKKVGFDARGYGNYIVLDHPNGMQTLYAHLTNAVAFVGQNIQMGDPVGIGGCSGNSTGPHLHFEVKLDGVAVDPTMMFNFSTGAYRNYADNTQEIMQKNQTNSTLTLGHSLASKRTYVVRQGDTPVTVAQRAGISVMRLCQLNMIQDNEPLQIGRMLKLK